MRFEVFTAVNIQVEVFSVVTPCNVVVGTDVSECLDVTICRVTWNVVWLSPSSRWKWRQ